MKSSIKIIVAFFACTLLAGIMYAGNKDRSGSAGGSELLINPWARSSGWAGANMAGTHGLEGQFLNVAGMAFTKKSEILFSHTNYLKGSGIGINAFGFSQKVGASGVLGLGIVSMNFGDIMVTTADLPEGGIGTFSPSFMNIGLSYSKGFTDRIFGGMTFKVINQQISNARAAGVALDAGIQYISGKDNSTHFGIALKNVGPKMNYSGDGLSFRITPKTGVASSATTNNSFNVDQRSESFDLPSQLSIGGSHDFYVGGDTTGHLHRVSPAATFVSNSFSKDEFRLGVEYGFKTYLMLRVGWTWESGIGNDDNSKTVYRTTAQKGLSAGFTFEVPLRKETGSSFGLDYSYRATNPFLGTHSIGLRMNL